VRRYLGFVMIGLGVALVTLGGSLTFWAYPRIAQVSSEYPSAKDREIVTSPPVGVQVSTGRAAVFVAVAGHPVGPQAVDVVVTRTTKGDPVAAHGSSVYWESRVDTALPGVVDKPIGTTIEGVCFDAHSAGQKADCPKRGFFQDGTAASSRTDYDRRPGVYLRFPFSTETTTYDLWDTAAGKYFPALYVGAEDVEDLAVYKFVQVVPEQNVGFRKGLPGEFFGRATGGPVTADIRYSNIRTVWVEPETGTIVRTQEEIKRLYVANGTAMPALVGTLRSSDDSVHANVVALRDQAWGLRSVRSTIPRWTVLLGLVLTVVGIGLGFAGTPDLTGTFGGVGDADGAPLG